VTETSNALNGDFEISQAGPSDNPNKSSHKAQKRGIPHFCLMALDIRSRTSILGLSQKWLKVKPEPRLIQEGRRQQLITTDPLNRESYSTNKADRKLHLEKNGV